MPEPKQMHRRILNLVDPSYQPSKAELEEDVSVDASPEEIARAVLRPTQIVYVKPPTKPKKKGRPKKHDKK